MTNEIPYMQASKNITAILEKMMHAAQPTTFTLDFLKDLGFPSSNDRGVIKMLKYIGLLDQNGKPQEAYRKFLDQTQSKYVLAEQLRIAYDDLFNANKHADEMSIAELKGWFRTKTGVSEAVAEKIATTFKTFVDFADFSRGKQVHPIKHDKVQSESSIPLVQSTNGIDDNNRIGLVYRFEIHLPDTQNIDTYRAIFKALKEELIK
ncbi:DUF5343 domain-containing protein [Treponema denticola]|uniref:DUF5343 domain-containing protein n=1 Tax=Treponema denticola TaxID=158 RepID=UPI0020A57F44|nr:DUF5343 domain-containing protein [Treponema denticola]UTD13672.1 DUF5343 domain-containing protein [Treponema denticola]